MVLNNKICSQNRLTPPLYYDFLRGNETDVSAGEYLEMNRFHFFLPKNARI